MLLCFIPNKSLVIGCWFIAAYKQNAFQRLSLLQLIVFCRSGLVLAPSKPSCWSRQCCFISDRGRTGANNGRLTKYSQRSEKTVLLLLTLLSLSLWSILVSLPPHISTTTFFSCSISFTLSAVCLHPLFAYDKSCPRIRPGEPQTHSARLWHAGSLQQHCPQSNHRANTCSLSLIPYLRISLDFCQSKRLVTTIIFASHSS